MVFEKADKNSKYKWDLTHIYLNDTLWQKDFDYVVDKLSGYKQFQDSFTRSPESLLSCLKFNEVIEQKMGLLKLYAKLNRDLNQNLNENTERWAKIVTLEEKVNRASIRRE